MRSDGSSRPRLSALLAPIRSTDDRIRWLLHFTQRDLRKLPLDRWRELEGELYVFPLGAGHVMVERQGQRRWSPKRSEVLNVQKALAEGIRCLVFGGGWRIDVRAANDRSQRSSVSRLVFRDGRTGYVGDDWPCVLQMAAADLLIAGGSRIRKCEDCETLFLPAKNQSFCSPRCSRRVRIRRYRQRLRERQPGKSKKD